MTSVVQDDHGSLYATDTGGATRDGAVFRLNPPIHTGKWSLAVIYQFSGLQDAADPVGLVVNKLGMLYGITQYGGTGTACQGGCGAVFEIQR